MSFPQILLLAVGLAMDATAVAAARGALGRARAFEVVQVALLFGGAQALMPLLGWALGAGVGRWVAAFDHWIAFVVLGVLGVKMVRDSQRGHDACEASGGWRMLLGLALATSIDAFAVGLTLPLLRAPLAVSIATIGLVTALLSGAGLVAGRRFGALLGRRLDAFGGVVLILLGFKILIEHLLTHA